MIATNIIVTNTDNNKLNCIILYRFIWPPCLYNFDRYVDWLLTESQAHDVKVIEDFSELKAENISDEIVENTQDTMSILENYVNDLDVKNLNKDRLKALLKGLYVEASNMEI